MPESASTIHLRDLPRRMRRESKKIGKAFVKRGIRTGHRNPTGEAVFTRDKPARTRAGAAIAKHRDKRLGKRFDKHQHKKRKYELIMSDYVTGSRMKKS